MTTTPNQSNRPTKRRVKIPAGLAVGAALLLVAGLQASADPPNTDPGTAPIPAVPALASSKSLVAVVNFDDRDTAVPVTAEVRYGPAHSHLGDPPLLRLQVLDSAGAVLGEYNAWHPLWAFVEAADGSESRIILDQAEGRFVVPFNRDATVMTVTDIPRLEQVAAVDLTAPIRSFCVTNPTDPSCRVADLAVTAVTPTVVPAVALVGSSSQIKIETSLANLGPTTPMDAVVSYSVTAAPGVSVSPLTGTSEHTLSSSLTQKTLRDYDVACTQPGLHAITFTSSIAPSHPADIDLAPANNTATAVVTVDCVVPVTININPGASPNPINSSLRNGSTPVAVLSTAAGQFGNPVAFDASTIDAALTRFGARARILGGGGAVARAGRGHLEDALEPNDTTRDGDVDMTIQFVAPIDTGLVPADTEACVLGTFRVGSDQYRFWGCDSVRVR